jgi:hypothetical protein
MWCATVEQVGTAPVLPRSTVEEPEDLRRQQRGAVQDRRVDDLANSRTGGMPEAREQSGREQHAAAAVVTEQVQRGYGWTVRRTDGVQHSGDGEVREIVSGGGREWAVLSPARHPPVHEPGVDLVEGDRADAEAFGDARPEALDERIGAGSEIADERRPVRVFEIDGDRALAAVEQVVAWVDG